MGVAQWNIVFFRSRNGRCPFLDQTIVITHGTAKKQQKIRRSDIDLAMKYQGEYLQRGE